MLDLTVLHTKIIDDTLGIDKLGIDAQIILILPHKCDP